jgi:8-oxo-dGTP pyrophosphatase MutT (NUDIX family)
MVKPEVREHGNFRRRGLVRAAKEPGRSRLPPRRRAPILPAVPRLDAGFIEAYVFRRRGRRAEFLLLRRRPGHALAGVWQPVTGKLRPREPAARGALREIREETGVAPVRLWRLEGVRGTYDPRQDRVRFIVRFAAELDAGHPVRISREHTAHRFVSARQAARAVLWESQRDGFAEVRRQVLRGGPRARALEISARRPGR